MESEKQAFVESLKLRTKHFALRLIKMFQLLPKTDEARIIGKQLLRSATSVAANYRAANRARSQAEFYAKIVIVVEEADETLFWLEILEESNIVSKDKLKEIKQDSKEILKIISAIKNKYIPKKLSLIESNS
ncbi:MAG TPA: four helix bundle protein [Cytophagales bacterium]|nr:four helix bundle protein [Cytophagales bacterium]